MIFNLLFLFHSFPFSSIMSISSWVRSSFFSLSSSCLNHIFHCLSLSLILWLLVLIDALCSFINFFFSQVNLRVDFLNSVLKLSDFLMLFISSLFVADMTFLCKTNNNNACGQWENSFHLANLLYRKLFSIVLIHKISQNTQLIDYQFSSIFLLYFLFNIETIWFKTSFLWVFSSVSRIISFYFLDKSRWEAFSSFMPKDDSRSISSRVKPDYSCWEIWLKDERDSKNWSLKNEGLEFLLKY